MANDYINFLAAELARAKIEVILKDYGFTFKLTNESAAENESLIEECLKNGNALNEFYRKRLDMEVA